MKAWLGSTVFEVSQEQLDKLNELAEEAFMKTSDRSKGLQAAIDFCREQNCKEIKKAVVMKSKAGEAGETINWADLESVIEKVMQKILAKKEPEGEATI